MDDFSPLGRPYDYAVSCLAAADGDMLRLPQPLQTLLMVEAAQGIIETGGLAFFYEADFPNNPPYELFAAAYRRIGADAVATCIELSCQMFPFAQPELFAPLRELWLEKFALQADHPFNELSRRASSDASVWERLAEYVERNRSAFLPP